MEILEYGKREHKTIILIHGFESPYQIWDDYIAALQADYHVLVPVLPGHNVNRKEDFETFAPCAREIEDYCIEASGDRVYAIYGMSMGGVLACCIWQNRRLHIDKLILESSPLMSYGKIMTAMLTQQYLTITHKAQSGDQKVLQQAVGSMVTEDKLDVFVELLNQISDTTITNYIREIGRFRLPDNIPTPNTRIYYYYGSKPGEILFRKLARQLKKNYPSAETVCLQGKGHCEDALLHPQTRISELERVLSIR